MQRAPKIRLISLAGTAALAVAVPLAAAAAGTADTVRRTDDARAEPGAKHGAMSGGRSPEKPDKKSPKKSEKATDEAENSRSGGNSGDPLAALGLPLLSDGGRTSRCGPELASPQGIEAQTCVLAERGLTWARTYYRNPTGAPLRAVLTLLRPDGRTVQVHCEVAATGEPGVCETPTGATGRRGRAPYDAVAEISDLAGERLLLRSGGNSAPGQGSSDLRRKSRRGG
ncbi:hypothetical protein [Streptomyces chattanoogensis]|uniref:hypothetical protein n=1 Tax=Streptomyces chattanoogensis TaxID=66876 RepID=UPI0036B7E4D3